MRAPIMSGLLSQHASIQCSAGRDGRHVHEGSVADDHPIMFAERTTEKSGEPIPLVV